MKLISKIFISGEIKVLTGLHIGGSKTTLDIGGIDLNVIKTTEGVPYIPGSSLKGKMRTLLARESGMEKIEDDPDIVKEIFGDAPKGKVTGKNTRLIVRDSNLKNKKEMHDKDDKFSELEYDYTEGKWENTIIRKTGAAEHPRQLERVPSGAIFEFEFIYDEFDDSKTEGHLTEIKKAMRLLEDDYLGGSGSRGYGKIKFENVKFEKKTIDKYKTDNQRESITELTL